MVRIYSIYCTYNTILHYYQEMDKESSIYVLFYIIIRSVVYCISFRCTILFSSVKVYGPSKHLQGIFLMLSYAMLLFLFFVWMWQNEYKIRFLVIKSNITYLWLLHAENVILNESYIRKVTKMFFQLIYAYGAIMVIASKVLLQLLAVGLLQILWHRQTYLKDIRKWKFKLI